VDKESKKKKRRKLKKGLIDSQLNHSRETIKIAQMLLW